MPFTSIVDIIGSEGRQHQAKVDWQFTTADARLS
jgi:hypothetical protein